MTCSYGLVSGSVVAIGKEKRMEVPSDSHRMHQKQNMTRTKIKKRPEVVEK